MKKIEENAVRLSVRDLVEFVCKSGDIDTRVRTGASADAMLQGANAHRRIQKSMGEEYEAEVPLSMEFYFDDAVFIVDGRADGIIKTDPVTIDEIKGVYKDIDLLEEPEKVHLAQAEMYAYMVAVQNELTNVNVQITYVQLEEMDDDKKTTLVHTDITRRFVMEYTLEEIEKKALFYVEYYKKWVNFIVKHRKERKESALNFPFPYDYRPGQKKIVVQAYKTIEQGKRLFVQAPTGIGKTMSMLYPSVQSVSQGNADRIFYLTAKTVTGQVAEETMALFKERGLKFSFTKITAKDKMCILDERKCNPVDCERAKGHFDRVNEAVFDLITHETMIDMKTILNYAMKHKVCPYEFSLDVSLYTDVIICDYNYAFAPRVALKRYFESGNQGDYILLMDEAHNLVDRARDMYSATLIKEELLEAKQLFKNHKTITKWIERCNKILLQLKRECDKVTVFEEDTFPNALVVALMHLNEALMKFIDRMKNQADSEQILDFYFNVSLFLETLDYTEGYIRYASFDEGGRFFIKLFCINPASRLMERLSYVRASIFFSATFLPINYYKELLVGNKEEDAIYVDSPFDPSMRKLLLSKDVSSKYTRRGPEEYQRIADYLKTMVRAKKGKYLAFFPSHLFLNEVSEYLKDSDFDLLLQKRVMTEDDRKVFLSFFEDETDFSKEENRSLLGLSVMGGVFSEGIDLKKEALIGVAVIGTGLPQVCVERELIRVYYENQGENGFDYAYRFPGFNKVMQAAGRLIRTQEDTGIILLLDERFCYLENRKLFPKEWNNHEVIYLEDLSDIISDFWNEKDDEK